MSYIALIRRNSDGGVRAIHYPYEYSEFLWTQGNWSCDCNRELDFYRADAEEPPKHDPDDVCLGSGQFTVLQIETDGGQVFFPDDHDSYGDCIPQSFFDFSTLKSGETRTIEMKPHKWKRPAMNDKFYACENCATQRIRE